MPPRPGQPAPGPQPIPGVDSIVAVGSGKGGVGKTTLAVNLAVALAKLGHKVGLLEADVYGPNVPLMLGANATPRVIGENRIEPLERYGLKVISVGFLNPGDRPLNRRRSSVSDSDRTPDGSYRGFHALGRFPSGCAQGHRNVPPGESGYRGPGGEHELLCVPALPRGN